MKICFKCGEEKPIEMFYKHAMMADGHLNKCKECTKRDVRENRKDKVDYYREYDAWRFQARDEERERRDRYARTERGKAALKKATDKFKSVNPDARAAHVLLGNAVRRGEIKKPECCPQCGQFKPSRQIHAHHEDYSKPLEVVWMCAMCHVEHHGKASKYRSERK